MSRAREARGQGVGVGVAWVAGGGVVGGRGCSVSGGVVGRAWMVL